MKERLKYPSQKKVKELFKYRNDGNLTRKENSGTAKKGSVVGYLNNVNGYIRFNLKGKGYLVHRLIWIWHYGYLPENELDHINRIKTDNRIENLREVSRSCNIRNTGNQKRNTSGVKGVSWAGSKKKWEAYICVNTIQKKIGYHEKLYEAVLHRLAAEQCLDWEGCDSSSPAYQYALTNNLIVNNSA